MKEIILVTVLVVVLVSLVGCLVGCTSGTATFGETKTYDVASNIKSLDIRIGAADFTIVHGDKFSVESNLKNLTVTDEDGVLKVVEKTRNTVNYMDAKLKVCIPENMVFENVSIKTGAAKLTAQSISADSVDLKLGAGQVQFDNIEAEENISIKGGAGQISVLDGDLNNLNLELGVGQFDMTAKLVGESNLKFGVGESALTLKGSKDDYRFDIKNGVGTITIDGNTSAAFISNGGDGENLVKINGGVGATDITFEQ